MKKAISAFLLIICNTFVTHKSNAVMKEAQELLYLSPWNQKTIYDDLNCGKLTKLLRFRVKEVCIYAEQLRARRKNSGICNLPCCHRQKS
jgi:hypothetical protein